MNKQTSAEDGWQGFLKLCKAANSTEELEELYHLFLTPEEKEDLGLRLMLVRALLEEKKTQREISGVLNVSISRITRGSNALKIISNRLREFLRAHLVEF
jgi:TrpR family trp operon transcriptional repressor